MNAKAMPLGDVLSVTDGALVSRDHIDGVYRVLNFMTGDNLFTHQLPRAADECRPAILAQHPWLADIHPPEWDHDGDIKVQVFGWLDEMEAAHGPTVLLTPLADVDHTRIDPITELRMIRPDAEIIVVQTDGEP